MSLDILTIKYTDHDADKHFEHSIKHSGFAVINDHPIESDLIDEVYEDWTNYFSNEDKIKYVLSKVKNEKLVNKSCQDASDACINIIENGITKSMEKFNGEIDV